MHHHTGFRPLEQRRATTIHLGMLCARTYLHICLELQVQQMHFKLAPRYTRLRFECFTVPPLDRVWSTLLPREARGTQDTPGRSWVQGDLHAGRHVQKVQTMRPLGVPSDIARDFRREDCA